jgi:hypothetical protein
MREDNDGVVVSLILSEVYPLRVGQHNGRWLADHLWSLSGSP